MLKLKRAFILLFFIFLEMMAASIREEIRRLHRKKQLHFHPKLVESASPPETSNAPGSPSSSFSSVFPANTPDKPLFTFRQVSFTAFEYARVIRVH